MPSRAAQVAASPCFHSKAAPEPPPRVTDLIHTPCSQLTQLALVKSSPCSASPGPHIHSPPVISSPRLSSVNVCFAKVLSWEGRLVRQHTSAGNTLLAHPILHRMGSLTSGAGRAQSPTNCEAKASNSSTPPAWLKSHPFPGSAQAETPPAEPDHGGPHCSIPSQEAALLPHIAPSRAGPELEG